MARGVWAYCRVSTTKDEQELSLEEQERWARGHAAAAGDEITVIREQASAKSTVGRPKFQKMMAALEDLPATKRPRAIVATTLDRVSRDMTDMLLIARTLRSLKIELFIRDVGVVKADTFAQRAALVGQSMGGEAENEARSNRMKAMFERRRREGKPNTNKVPYGLQLESERDVPIPESAAWVLKAFEMYAEGIGGHRIAQLFKTSAAPHVIRSNKLGPDGLRITRTKFPRWESLRVMALLRQPRYRGAIVPPDLFDRVQNLIASKPRWRRDRICEYPLSGTIRCRTCGRGLAGLSSRPSYLTAKLKPWETLPPEQRLRYYRCLVCNYLIQALVLESWFKNDIGQLVGDPDLLELWIAGERGAIRDSALRREIAALERATDPATIDAARARIWDLALTGPSASADLERQLARIAAKLAADQERLTELRGKLDQQISAKHSIAEARKLLADFWLIYEGEEYESQRAMMGALIAALGGCSATKDGLFWTRDPRPDTDRATRYAVPREFDRRRKIAIS